MRSLAIQAAVVAGLTGVAHAQGAAPLEAAVIEALRARQFLDAHLLARTALALGPSSPDEIARHRVYDGLALLRLDDETRAREAFRLAAGSGVAATRRRAQVLEAWSFLRGGDERAFAEAMAILPGPTRLRLQVLAGASARQVLPLVDGLAPEDRTAAREGLQRLWAAERTRRPWLAAGLSAVLPGAGQAYAGSWQGAAVAFLMNALLIGATVELGRHELPVSAGAAGLAASFFYVGNVLNAADLATRRNEMAAAPARRALEERLLPEAYP
jgi:hypothetical protein